MKALNSSVDVLCAPSISCALNEAIGLVVRLKVSSVYLVPDDHFTAILPCKGSNRWLRHSTHSMSLSL
jgi:hypothetical protein